MKKIYHIHGRAPLFCNTFLIITNQGHAVVIDPDAPAADYQKLLDQENATLTHILLTHGHHDHIGSVSELQKGGAQLWMNPNDRVMYPSRQQAERLFGVHYAGLYQELEDGSIGFRPDGLYEDGGKLVVDEISFQTIFTPGHTKGSTCILCDGVMFSGDTLFCGDIGRTDFPGGDAYQMKESLLKLRRMIPDDTEVLPGHEGFTTMKREKEHNPYLKG